MTEPTTLPAGETPGATCPPDPSPAADGEDAWERIMAAGKAELGFLIDTGAMKAEFLRVLVDAVRQTHAPAEPATVNEAWERFMCSPNPRKEFGRILAAALARADAAEKERDKLQRFKDWVHNYLDTHGVPHHPPGTHGAEGCRIGDRMDWLMAELDHARGCNPDEFELVRSSERAAQSFRYEAEKQRGEANKRAEAAEARLVECKTALEVYARADFYFFLLDPIGQQTDPTKRAREVLAGLASRPSPDADGRNKGEGNT